MLISRERPRTIVEIGSSHGGSALWFAALARGLELDCRVLSLDINKVTTVSDPLVTFLQGDIHQLAASELHDLLQDCPRPLMVIEDGPHTFEACRAALDYFDGFMRKDEYLIMEDGILKDLGYTSLANGPNRAVKDFMRRRGDAYVVDREWCDFYGRNVTWNPNGYLRRVAS